MTETQNILTAEEREILHKTLADTRKGLWASGIFTVIEIGLACFIMYEVYTLIRLQEEVLIRGIDFDTLLVVLFLLLLFGVILFLIKFTFQMFFQYLRKHKPYKHDQLASQIQVNKGRIIGSEVQGRGLRLVFEDQREVVVDFAFLMASTVAPIACLLLTPAKVEIRQLPHSHTALKIVFPEFAQEILERYTEGKPQKWICGVVTFVISYRAGHGLRYRGANLDPTKKIVQIGNLQTLLPFGYNELPEVGAYVAYPFHPPTAQ